jgi:hypothetical protein
MAVKRFKTSLISQGRSYGVLSGRANLIPIASGGNVQDLGGFRIHSFTTVGSSSFVITANVTSVEYLVVAGGGNGSILNTVNPSIAHAGGGAGGLLQGSQSTNTGNYTVTVGGGTENSVFGSITATRGGNGDGNSGGSGGGGLSHQSNQGQAGGAGTSGQGNNGGNGYFPTGVQPERSGGGGGAGAAGQAGNLSVAGNGGEGISSSIGGSPIVYAGGGGGSARTGGYGPDQAACGVGGSGGGGNALSGGSIRAGSGQTNRGGGGGGYCAAGASPYGGAGFGGSGIVIIRYPLLGYQYD